MGIKSSQVWGEVKATAAAWRVGFGAARRVERSLRALLEPDGGWDGKGQPGQVCGTSGQALRIPKEIWGRELGERCAFLQRSTVRLLLGWFGYKKEA